MHMYVCPQVKIFMTRKKCVKNLPLLSSKQSVCEAPLDTVGAVCVDQRGGVAGGVSSGGISLKFPGRIGQVSVLCVTEAAACGLSKPSLSLSALFTASVSPPGGHVWLWLLGIR